MKRGHSKTICDKTGVVTLEIYYKDNKRHRDPAEGPALVRRSARTGNVRCAEYWVDGKLHRDPKDGPARRGIPANNRRILEEVYMFNGKLHRPIEDGPAWAETLLRTGIVFCTMYFEKGEIRSPHIHYDPETGDLLGISFREYNGSEPYLHREDGPAEMQWINGNCAAISYYQFHHLHRGDGPAQIFIDPDTDVVAREAYYVCGRLSRPPADGPAVIERDRFDGTITAEEYWVDGKRTPSPARPGEPLRGSSTPRAKIG